MNFDSLDDSQHKLITVRLILFESFIVCFVLYSLNCIVNSNRKFVITRTRHSRLRPTSISQECSVVCSGNKLVICFWAVPKYYHQLQVTLLTVLRDWNTFPTWTQTIQVFQPYIRNYIHYPPPLSPNKHVMVCTTLNTNVSKTLYCTSDNHEPHVLSCTRIFFALRVCCLSWYESVRGVQLTTALIQSLTVYFVEKRDPRVYRVHPTTCNLSSIRIVRGM